MKRIGSLVLAVLLLTGTASAQEAAAQSPLELSAPSAVLMEKETGTILYEKEAKRQMEPASVTKVMTLLLIMEALDSGRISREDVVTVSGPGLGHGRLPGLFEGRRADDGGRAHQVHHRGLRQ